MKMQGKNCERNERRRQSVLFEWIEEINEWKKQSSVASVEVEQKSNKIKTHLFERSSSVELLIKCL